VAGTDYCRLCLPLATAEYWLVARGDVSVFVEANTLFFQGLFIMLMFQGYFERRSWLCIPNSISSRKNSLMTNPKMAHVFPDLDNSSSVCHLVPFVFYCLPMTTSYTCRSGVSLYKAVF
jgi:hypothetical protein